MIPAAIILALAWCVSEDHFNLNQNYAQHIDPES